MRVTWKDGVTTIAAGAAVVLERAYFHNWDWPLISSMDWAIAGMAGLLAIGFIFSYALDAYKGTTWSIVAGLIGVLGIVLTGLGLYYTNTDYVVMLMLTNVLFWIASIVRHLTVHMPTTYGHA